MHGLQQTALWLTASVILSTGLSGPASMAQNKKVVKTQADLPRLSYSLPQPPSAFLDSADDATFRAFAQKIESDVDDILTSYDIQDRATQRQILKYKVNLDHLRGDWDAEQRDLSRVSELQDKPDEKLTSGLAARAWLAARKEANATSGPAFENAFKTQFTTALNALPPAQVQDWAKEERQGDEMLSAPVLTGVAKANLDPQFAKTSTLDLQSANELVTLRLTRDLLPTLKAELEVLNPYVAAHTAQKPDIWAARDVTFTPDQKLTPVRIAIFDSGVDTSLFPGQLFVDPQPGPHSPHGLAFDSQGNLYNGDLQPLTPEQRAMLPKAIAFLQGSLDMNEGIDSPAAAETKKTVASMNPDQLRALIEKLDFIDQYIHGTHVAGIAVRGNPAARLVVIQFNDKFVDLPFAPTVAWAEHFKTDFRQVGDYLREHDVRVVNMSWADSQSEIEQWLNKTSSEKDPEVRKKLAAQIYAVWRDAVAGAIQAAPKTLFVCGAGNADADASFLGDVPASLQLPNLITVGAVDQSGAETSFTSYGPSVVLDANGSRVESVVPGGAKLKLSGTSMASPNVANLAAKLFALDPALTPEQVIALMKQGAHASTDGRLHLIDPKGTVALLAQQQAAK